MEGCRQANTVACFVGAALGTYRENVRRVDQTQPHACHGAGRRISIDYPAPEASRAREARHLDHDALARWNDRLDILRLNYSLSSSLPHESHCCGIDRLLVQYFTVYRIRQKVVGSEANGDFFVTFATKRNPVALCIVQYSDANLDRR